MNDKINPQGYNIKDAPTNTNPFWGDEPMPGEKETLTVKTGTTSAAPLPAGATPTASVKNSGSDYHAVLVFEFGIPAGEPGEKGDKGEKGDPGSAGPQGPEGPQGKTGPAGPKGDPGPQGEPGSQGPAGTVSIGNVTATAGETASAEVTNSGTDTNASLNFSFTLPRGEKGDPGPQGEPGLTGPQGERGPAGPRGPKGEPGPEGPQGPKGDKGDTGDPGPQGEAGPEGPEGPTGAQGPEGPRGPQGEKGDQGPKGEPGTPGKKGDPGPEGPKGDAGPKGDTGAQGPAGTVSIGNVTATAGETASAEVTNSGTDTDAILNFNFEIPQGGAGQVPPETLVAKDLTYATVFVKGKFTADITVMEITGTPGATILANTYQDIDVKFMPNPSFLIPGTDEHIEKAYSTYTTVSFAFAVNGVDYRLRTIAGYCPYPDLEEFYIQLPNTDVCIRSDAGRLAVAQITKLTYTWSDYGQQKSLTDIDKFLYIPRSELNIAQVHFEHSHTISEDF